jgi:AcrR family transcriptional regulator
METQERSRLPAQLRRAQILDTAFAAIAEVGLESFRIRDVAVRAGINAATLLHYFPTKEVLVAAVATRLEEFYATHRPGSSIPAVDARARLRAEFADVAEIRREHPNVWEVHRELIIRSDRDPAIAAIVTRLTDGWRTSVRAILAAGRHSGAFRADIDIDRAADVIVSALWGAATLLHASAEGLAAMADQFDSWLGAPEGHRQ